MDSEQTLTSMIVPFYLGELSDLKGRKIQQIWAWDVEELECVHDYIQWLFPLPDKSYFNASAPVVDQDVIQTFRESRRLQQNLLRSLSVMLHFYGLTISREDQDKVVVEQSENYLVRKQEWVSMLDHNYLRITRILKCLMTFDRGQEAQALYECLKQIYKEEGEQIGGETFHYWTDAVTQVLPSNDLNR